jgi:trehalose 6-phosphate phosphatase
LRDASPPESSLPPGPSLDRALALARHALAATPAGLLTDFDGTLSPMVADPDAARPIPGADRALAALAERLAVVAIVTGRASLDARRMIGVPALLVAGNHGIEVLEPSTDAPVASPGVAGVRADLSRLVGRVPADDGISVEDKGLSATVHYRTAADPEAARRAILEALDHPGPRIELRPGRMSIELRPVGLGDKGSATRAIVERYGLRGVVAMGDDVTDLDMFAAVDELRRAGAVRGAIIGVGGADGEVPPAVAEAADVVVSSPEAAARLLSALAAAG